MKVFATVFCCFVIVAGVANSGEASNQVVSIAAERILENPGVLPAEGHVSSGQPNEAVLKSFADAGYMTVIDMRMPEEERGFEESTFVETLGMTYIRFPIGKAEDINFENAAALDRLMSGMDQPALLHCTSGNRVGALIALRAKINGSGNEDALEIGKAAGLTRLEPVVRRQLGIK